MLFEVDITSQTEIEPETWFCWVKNCVQSEIETTNTLLLEARIEPTRIINPSIQGDEKKSGLQYKIVL